MQNKEKHKFLKLVFKVQLLGVEKYDESFQLLSLDYIAILSYDNNSSICLKKKQKKKQQQQKKQKNNSLKMKTFLCISQICLYHTVNKVVEFTVE